jgi:hypothetical protein
MPNAFPERQGGPRRGRGYYTSPGELADVAGALPTMIRLGVKIEVMAVTVTVREGDAEFRLRAVLQVDSSPGSANARRTAAGGSVPPGAGSPGRAVQVGEGDRDSGVSDGVAGRSAGSAGIGSEEYPFTIVELVEDPPATSIAPASEFP